MNLLKKQIDTTVRKIQGFPVSLSYPGKVIHCMANEPLAHKRCDHG